MTHPPMPDTTLTSAELDEMERTARREPQRIYPPDILRLLSLARAGLEAGKADEWLPIETAPKDGTRIICGRFTGDPEAMQEGYVVVDWYRTAPKHPYTGFGEFNMTSWPPTHWRPPPAPPAIRALPLTGGDNA